MNDTRFYKGTSKTNSISLHLILGRKKNLCIFYEPQIRGPTCNCLNKNFLFPICPLLLTLSALEFFLDFVQISIINTYFDWKDLKEHYLDSKNMAENKKTQTYRPRNNGFSKQRSNLCGGEWKLGRNWKVARLYFQTVWSAEIA